MQWSRKEESLGAVCFLGSAIEADQGALFFRKERKGNAPKEHEQQAQAMSSSTCSSGCFVCEQQLHMHRGADEMYSISSHLARHQASHSEVL